MQPARHRMGRDWAAKGRTVADSVKKKKKSLAGCQNDRWH